MAAYYAAFLDLTGRRCLVIGGGPVAERKVVALRDAGAAVVVISPGLTSGLAALAATGTISWEPRPYRAGDLAGAALVIAATDRPEVNQAIGAEARRLELLIDVVDSPESGNFITPALVRRGPLTLAISTGGRSPALAKRVREEIEALLPPESADNLDDLIEFRQMIRERVAVVAARETVWRDLMAGGLIDLLRRGERAEARQRVRETADRAATGPGAGGAA